MSLHASANRESGPCELFLSQSMYCNTRPPLEIVASLLAKRLPELWRIPDDLNLQVLGNRRHESSARRRARGLINSSFDNPFSTA